MSNGAMTIVEDDESLLGAMVRPEASVSTAIQLAGVLIDKRVATARQWPRSISRFKKEAGTLIREDVELARAAEYAKPIGGGTAKGASIRLLEIAATCWGNLDDGMVEAAVEDKSVRVTWYAYDLEKNNRSEGYSSTSIIDKYGKRYPNHLIETNLLATASKARRNALEKVIPKAFIKDLLQVAKEVRDKNKEPMDVARANLLDYFARSRKVTPEQVFAVINVQGPEDITEDHLDELRAIANSLNQGETKVSDWFSEETGSKTAAIKAKLDERKAKTTTKTEAATEPAKTGAPDKLTDLIKDFDARGGDWPAFLGEHGVQIEDVMGSKNKARSEWCTRLNGAIQKLAGGEAK